MNNDYFIGPDFVGIGAQKSGTTWVGQVLNQHPNVYIKKKEISFFTHNFYRGYDWYSDFFKDKGTKKAGEITPGYIISPRQDSSRKEFYPHFNPRRSLLFWQKNPSARNELKKNFPNVKVFAIFRNPVDRAWSHYWMWKTRKERLKKRVVPFEKIFSDDGRWIYTYGCYADQVAYWRESFPDMGIFFYDDLKENPKKLAKDIYSFVEVDGNFDPSLGKKVNVGSYESMPEYTRRKLIDVYREQITRFSEMTGRDLSHWLEMK